MIPASFAIHAAAAAGPTAEPDQHTAIRSPLPATAGAPQVPATPETPAAPAAPIPASAAADPLTALTRPDSAPPAAPLFPAPPGQAPVHASSGLPPGLAAQLSGLLARPPDGLVEILLSPDELGRLRISLSPEGAGLHVAVHVERAETLDLLRRNADVLLAEIRAQGFAGASFSFSGWAGDQTGARPQAVSLPGMIQPETLPPALPPPVPAAGLDLRL